MQKAIVPHFKDEARIYGRGDELQGGVSTWYNKNERQKKACLTPWNVLICAFYDHFPIVKWDVRTDQMWEQLHTHKCKTSPNVSPPPPPSLCSLYCLLHFPLLTMYSTSVTWKFLKHLSRWELQAGLCKPGLSWAPLAPMPVFRSFRGSLNLAFNLASYTFLYAEVLLSMPAYLELWAPSEGFRNWNKLAFPYFQSWGSYALCTTVDIPPCSLTEMEQATYSDHAMENALPPTPLPTCSLASPRQDGQCTCHWGRSDSLPYLMWVL